MLSAADQLQQIDDGLLGTGSAPMNEGVIRVLPDDVEGSLRLDLLYASGHSLRVQVAIDTRHGYPNWTRYSFHFQDEHGQCVFRYDNFPYHHDVETFPDHKHVGPAETVQPHLRPTLRHVIDEILTLLHE